MVLISFCKFLRLEKEGRKVFPRETFETEFESCLPRTRKRDKFELDLLVNRNSEGEDFFFLNLLGGLSAYLRAGMIDG